VTAPGSRAIGVVACSTEGAALCYRSICLEALPLMGEHNHPEIILQGFPMADYMPALNAGDWEAVGRIMLASVRKVAAVGAAFAICPDNTIHQAFDFVAPHSPIPWLHIADVVGEEASRRGFRRLGVLGTRYLMDGPVYPAALGRRGIDCRFPSPERRAVINRAIFRELVNAIFTDETRAMFHRSIADFAAEGCDAVVLGCTEIPLIVRPEEAALPTLDSTRLLARAAVRRALEP
jgi:aspartate racemase